MEFHQFSYFAPESHGLSAAGIIYVRRMLAEIRSDDNLTRIPLHPIARAQPNIWA